MLKTMITINSKIIVDDDEDDGYDFDDGTDDIRMYLAQPMCVLFHYTCILHIILYVQLQFILVAL